MSKSKYIVTELAGPMVAGIKSPGAKKPIELTESQAEHPLRQGYIARPEAGKASSEVKKPAEKRAPTKGK